MALMDERIREAHTLHADVKTLTKQLQMLSWAKPTFADRLKIMTECRDLLQKLVDNQNWLVAQWSSKTNQFRRNIVPHDMRHAELEALPNTEPGQSLCVVINGERQVIGYVVDDKKVIYHCNDFDEYMWEKFELSPESYKKLYDMK